MLACFTRKHLCSSLFLIKLQLLIFAFKSANKSQSNNILKNEGGNEELKPKQKQRVKYRKTSGRIRCRDSI